MTFRAQHHEVVSGVGPTVGAERLVVQLEVGHRATGQTSPTVALEDRTT
jgi:hypothetical protein